VHPQPGGQRRLDDDVAPMQGLRIVQLTPPGSGTSVTFGNGLTAAAYLAHPLLGGPAASLALGVPAVALAGPAATWAS